MIRFLPGDRDHAAMLWLGPIGLRFGRQGFRTFSERYGGTHGIPKRHYPLFGGRLTVIKRRRQVDLSQSSGVR